MRGFAQHLHTLINFSDLRELVNFPCTTIGVGDCEANQSSWHKAFVLQECPLGGQSCPQVFQTATFCGALILCRT